MSSKTQFLQKMQMTVSLLDLLGWLGVGEYLAPRGCRTRRRSNSQILPLGKGGPDHRGVSLTCVQSGWPSSGLSAAEVEAEVGRLQKACLLLRLRMEEELRAGQWTLI